MTIVNPNEPQAESEARSSSLSRSEETRKFRSVAKRVVHKVTRKSSKFISQQESEAPAAGIGKEQPLLSEVSFATTGTPVLLDAAHKQKAEEIIMKSAEMVETDSKKEENLRKQPVSAVMLKPAEEVVPFEKDVKEELVPCPKKEIVAVRNPEADAILKQVSVIPNQHKEVALVVDKNALIMPKEGQKNTEITEKVEMVKNETKEI